MSEKKCSVVNPGNTKTGLTTSKKRFACNFQITINCEINDDPIQSKEQLYNKYNNILDYLNSLKYRYIIACDEINKKGFHHIHIFLQFDKARKLSLKKLLGSHLEICKGSTEDNINYIKKDNNIIYENGTPKLMYKASIRDVINHANNDDLLDMDTRYIKCINEIKNNSIIWNQPIFNTTKDIYFIDHYDEKLIKNCKCINIINNKFQYLQPNILIDLSDYLLYNNIIDENTEYDYDKDIDLNIIPLLQKLNKPLNCINQIYYPADIKKIVLIYPSKQKKIILNWFCDNKLYFNRHNTHISLINDNSYYEGELEDEIEDEEN